MKTIMIMLMLLSFGAKAQINYQITTDNGYRTKMMVDTTTGFASMNGHLYTARAAWMNFEMTTDEVNEITVVKNGTKPFIIKSVMDKYGIGWVVNGSKTVYASLVEAWYRRMLK